MDKIRKEILLFESNLVNGFNEAEIELLCSFIDRIECNMKEVK